MVDEGGGLNLKVKDCCNGSGQRAGGVDNVARSDNMKPGT